MRPSLTILAALLFAISLAVAQTVEKQEAPKDEPAGMKAKTTIVGEIAVKSIPAITAVVVLEKAADYAPEGGYKDGPEGASQAYQRMMTEAFEKLGMWMKAGNYPKGPCFAIYHEDPTTTAARDLTCKVGFPVGKDAKEHELAKIEQLPEQQCAVVQYQGPYAGSMEAWDALKKWMTEHHYEMSGAPSEVYLKGPADNVTPEEYLTEVRIPVRKPETQEEIKKSGKSETKQ